VKTKIAIDNSRLLQRMKRYEEVTGKQVADSMRRGARLLAVNLAYNTPPFGDDPKALKLGERAVMNDILRFFLPVKKLSGLPEAKTNGLEGMAESLGNRQLGEAIKASIEQSVLPGRSKKRSEARAKGIADLRAILKNAGKWSSYDVTDKVDASAYRAARNSYGRFKGRGSTIVADTKGLVDFLKHKKGNVGLSKAAWAAAAIKVNATVKNALAGIPAWVKRHVEKAPCSVTDRSESALPIITLTSKIPWADKALRTSAYREALRITREKFYNSMGTELRHALKSQQAS
jgi:hypothetical protein